MRKNWILTFAVLAVCLALTAPTYADWAQGVAAFKSGDLNTAVSEFRTQVEAQPDWRC
jgi:hypothetical protein